VNGTGDTLLDFSAAGNPYFLDFELAQDDPFVDLNNLPLVCTPDCVDGPGVIGGNVFNDLDNNGADAGAGEAGQAEVLVQIYDCDGMLVCEVFTNADGNWSCDGLTDTEEYRVEFSTPNQDNLQPSFAGVDNGSDVQFVTAPSCVVNYGVLDDNVFCPPAVVENHPIGGLSSKGTLLSSGISVVTCGIIDDPTFTTTTQYTLGLIDIRNVTLANDRPQATLMDFHHPDWTVTRIGNVYGTTTDDSGNFYATASSHYGSGFGYVLGADVSNFRASILKYGEIGGGENDTGAAGTVYKMDAATGQPVVFAQLPQQSFNFDHIACESGVPYNRTTGPGLGNIEYDEVHEQFFVSNFEDGKIYRLDADGNQLDDFDPQTLTGFTADDGTAGFANDFKPYGMAVSPDGRRLYFGIHPVDNNPATSLTEANVYYVDLAADGSFLGTEQFVVMTTPDPSGTAFGSDPNAFGANPAWYSVSDLNFNPDGELVIGHRSGCGDGLVPFFASSHNHGASYFIYDLNTNVLTNVESRYNGDTGNDNIGFTDGSGNDDVYGGIGIWNTHDDDFLYVVTSSDIREEVGPHGLLLFPDDFTQTGNGTTEYILRPAAAVPYFENFDLNDFKGVGGDLEVFSPCGPTPIQIGNYVWIDEDEDGVQDACEPPVTGLPVTLYTEDDDGTLTQVDMTTTDAVTGEYYFDNVIQDTSYVIVFGDMPTTPSTFTYSDQEYELTDLNSGEGSTPDLNDSDAAFMDVNGDNLPAISYSTADTTDHTLDVGLIEVKVFDLALVKLVDATATPGPFAPDSTVTFSVTVYNQGGIDATDVEVKDYVPEGLSLAPASAPNWTVSVDTAILTMPFSLAAGADSTLSISFVIDADFMGDTLVNRAEISNFDDDNDPLTDPPIDEDSTPNDNGMDAAEVDTPDEQDDDGDGTPGTMDDPADEDDYDWEGIPVVQNFDLALVKRIDLNATPGPFTYGSTVTFEIEVVNQGSLDATGVEVSDYIPDGLSLVTSADWTQVVDTAVLAMPFDLAAGGTEVLSISFTIDLDFAGTMIDNVAEISAADNALGLPDEDSRPGDNGNDAPEVATDDEINDDGPNGNGVPDVPADADDFDLARVSIETVSLGSTVFLDNNNDGLQNGTDAGIPMVEVQLFDAATMMPVLTDANGARVLTAGEAAPTLTDPDGNYHFTNLIPGDYYVVIPTTPTAAPISSNTTGIAFMETDPDDNLDNDDEGIQAGGSGMSVSSDTITLALGDEPLGGAVAGAETAQGNAQDDAFDSNGNMTLDFGFFAPVSVGDTAFVDLDGDGLQTLGEPGIGGVTVALLDSNGDTVTVDAEGNMITGVTTTDPDGRYFFDNLPPGSYSVAFDISTADNAEFYDFTMANAGDDADDSDNSIALSDSTAQSDPTAFLNSGETDLTLDVGVVCAVEVEVAQPFTICSTANINLNEGASIMPSTLGGTWSTPDGTGTFDGGMDFATATTYTPSSEDALRGSVTLILTTNEPDGPCEAVTSVEVIVTILNVDCGSFFWDGSND